jgi:hypothetical protein
MLRYTNIAYLFPTVFAVCINTELVSQQYVETKNVVYNFIPLIGRLCTECIL